MYLRRVAGCKTRGSAWSGTHMRGRDADDDGGDSVNLHHAVQLLVPMGAIQHPGDEREVGREETER